MLTEQSHTLDPTGAIVGIEDLAESFIDPRYRAANYTMRGITVGDSRDSHKLLLPERYRTRSSFQIVTGVNFPTFAVLLQTAGLINDEPTEPLGVTSRFDM